jgi:hypothetical protein
VRNPATSDRASPAQALVDDLERASRAGLAWTLLAGTAYLAGLAIASAVTRDAPPVFLVGLAGTPVLATVARRADLALDQAFAGNNARCPCGGRFRWQRRGKRAARPWCLACGTAMLDSVARIDRIAGVPRDQRPWWEACAILVLATAGGVAMAWGLGEALGGEVQDGMIAVGLFSLAAGTYLANAWLLKRRFAEWGDAIIAANAAPDAATEAVPRDQRDAGGGDVGAE